MSDIRDAAEVWVSTSKNGDYVSAQELKDSVRFVRPDLSPTQSEHDKRVRADALREVAGFVRSYTTAQHVASDIKAGIFPEQTPVCEAMARDILALIEREA